MEDEGERSGPVRVKEMIGFFKVVLLLGGPLLEVSPQQPLVNLEDPAVVETGRTIFARSCSVGYCHGIEGRSGRGPRLRGKQWEPDYLFRVTLEGIPRSSMPAWRGKLSEKEIWSAVAYLMTLSDPDGAETPGPPTAPAAGAENQGSLPASPPELRQAAAGTTGEPEKGRELFFDSSDDLNCAHCHRVRGMGAEVGPDLSGLANRPSKGILRDIVLPGYRLSAGKQLFKLTTVAGERLTVLKASEDDPQVKVYDVTGLPPVLRTLERSQIQTLEPEAGSPMPATYGQRYTLKQLLDLVSFLKSTDSGSPSIVSLENLLDDEP